MWGLKLLHYICEVPSCWDTDVRFKKSPLYFFTDVRFQLEPLSYVRFEYRPITHVRFGSLSTIFNIDVRFQSLWFTDVRLRSYCDSDVRFEMAALHYLQLRTSHNEMVKFRTSHLVNVILKPFSAVLAYVRFRSILQFAICTCEVPVYAQYSDVRFQSISDFNVRF